MLILTLSVQSGYSQKKNYRVIVNTTQSIFDIGIINNSTSIVNVDTDQNGLYNFINLSLIISSNEFQVVNYNIDVNFNNSVSFYKKSDVMEINEIGNTTLSILIPGENLFDSYLTSNISIDFSANGNSKSDSWIFEESYNYSLDYTKFERSDIYYIPNLINMQYATVVGDYNDPNCKCKADKLLFKVPLNVTKMDKSIDMYAYFKVNGAEIEGYNLSRYKGSLKLGINWIDIPIIIYFANFTDINSINLTVITSIYDKGINFEKKIQLGRFAHDPRNNLKFPINPELIADPPFIIEFNKWYLIDKNENGEDDTLRIEVNVTATKNIFYSLSIFIYKNSISIHGNKNAVNITKNTSEKVFIDIDLIRYGDKIKSEEIVDIVISWNLEIIDENGFYSGNTMINNVKYPNYSILESIFIYVENKSFEFGSNVKDSSVYDFILIKYELYIKKEGKITINFQVTEKPYNDISYWSDNRVLNVDEGFYIYTFIINGSQINEIKLDAVVIFDLTVEFSSSEGVSYISAYNEVEIHYSQFNANGYYNLITTEKPAFKVSNDVQYPLNLISFILIVILYRKKRF